MADHTELELGAQIRAAGTVADALPQVEQTLRDLTRELQTGLEGLRGASGAAFAAAVGAWLEVAAGLVPTLGYLAEGLVKTDLVEATTDAHGSASFSIIQSVLDGAGSGQ